jgi:branched-chain amino acid transport system substrate-binding protein
MLSLRNVVIAAAILVITGAAFLVARGEPGPIRIGVVLSDDGVLGARIAAGEVSAAGGVAGRKLSVLVTEEASTAAHPAIELAERLSADPTVIAVVGHSNSAATLAASQTYNRHHVPQIAPTSSAPAISQAGEYTFRLVASDEYQGKFLADAITEGGKIQRVAILYVNDEYGRALYGELREQLRRREIPVVYEAPFLAEPRFTWPATLARSVVEQQPDVLVWIGRPGELAILLPQLREMLPRLSILASDGVQSQKFHQNEDGIFTGVRFVRFRDVESDANDMRALRERFRSDGGLALTDEAALAYEAIHLVAAAIAAGGARRENVRDYLASLGSSRPPYAGPLGPIAFDSNGDAKPHYVMSVLPPPDSASDRR